jgi:hypothetical protein
VQAHAFGLQIDADVALDLLDGTTAVRTGRRLAISVAPGGADALGWPSASELISDERDGDDAIVFQMHAHPDAGFLIAGPDYGAFLLSPDGRHLVCATEGLASAVWQRMLIAQALPFAALLQGLEVLHAAAVVHDGSAVAFLGRSRAGKTSLALAMCHRGARFLADDVLAIEPLDDSLLAHPGTAVAGIDRDRILRTADAPPYATVATTTRERLVRVERASGPVPLAALLFLERDDRGPEQPVFRRDASPRALLAATFNFVLATPERLQRLLEVSALAAQLHVERIVVASTTSPAELAECVERRLRERRR